MSATVTKLTSVKTLSLPSLQILGLSSFSCSFESRFVILSESDGRVGGRKRKCVPYKKNSVTLKWCEIDHICQCAAVTITNAGRMDPSPFPSSRNRIYPENLQIETEDSVRGRCGELSSDRACCFIFLDFFLELCGPLNSLRTNNNKNNNYADPSCSLYLLAQC